MAMAMATAMAKPKATAKDASAAACAAMAAIERGEPCARDAEGQWRIAGRPVDAAVIAELERRDLARIAGPRLLPTGAGRGFTQRRARPEGAGRLLAERATGPGDGDRPGGAARGGEAARPGAAPARDDAGGDRAPARRARPARSVTVNLAESPLGWLHARGHVSADQLAAGERLRADWTLAGLEPRVTMRWDAAPGGQRPRGPGGTPEPTLARIAARRRFDGAIAAAGPGLSDILWRVACAGEGIEAAEKALGWPRRAGKLILAMALDRVAGFYGMASG